jgi:flavin reductase (DIM6/NTAB) family NADH-FMN oxidoreductase RutF
VTVSTSARLAEIARPGPEEAGTPEEFRTVMAELASTVAVVTAAAGEIPVGLTVSSLTSYSDQPPSICFNVREASRSHGALTQATSVGVHLLAEDQWEVAKAFSSSAADKFTGLRWEWDGGLPRLAGGLAFLRCAPVAVFRHGDHSILVAEVRRACALGGHPLVYRRRSAGWRVAAVLG